MIRSRLNLWPLTGLVIGSLSCSDSPSPGFDAAVDSAPAADSVPPDAGPAVCDELCAALVACGEPDIAQCTAECAPLIPECTDMEVESISECALAGNDCTTLAACVQGVACLMEK